MRKSYKHLKHNMLVNLSYIYGADNIIKLVEEDKVEKALKIWDNSKLQTRFSFSSAMARMQIEYLKNGLVALAEALK